MLCFVSKYKCANGPYFPRESPVHANKHGVSMSSDHQPHYQPLTTQQKQKKDVSPSTLLRKPICQYCRGRCRDYESYLQSQICHVFAKIYAFSAFVSDLLPTQVHDWWTVADGFGSRPLSKAANTNILTNT